jgi:hypothetical protein
MAAEPAADASSAAVQVVAASSVAVPAAAAKAKNRFPLMRASRWPLWLACAFVMVGATRSSSREKRAPATYFA